jgi:hypothetical protein
MNNENTASDTIEDLDVIWIKDFENLDNEYKSYYTEELSFIRIHSIYVNNDNDIEKLREEKIILKIPGFLQKEELLSIIKHNSYSNDIKYSLLSILKFNINIEPSNLNNFLRSKDKNIGSFFLQSIKNIDTIKFDKSISLFHDINEIIIVFHEKINKQNTSSFANNFTKKIRINTNSKKKTRRK